MKLNYKFSLYILLLIIIIAPITLVAQNIPYYSGALTHEWLTCPYDTSAHYYSISSWNAYQTLNNRVDGLQDSTLCISLKADTSYGGISIAKSSIDTNKAIYLKADLHADNAILLEIDLPYNLYPNAITQLDSFYMVLEDTCSDGVCSGIIMQREVTGTDWGPFTLNDIYSASSFALPGQDAAVCFASAHQTEQYMTSFIYRIQPRNWPDTLYINCPYSLGEMQIDYYFIEGYSSMENMIGFYEHGNYIIEPYEVFTNTIFLLNDKDQEPIPTNTDTILVSPYINPDTAVNIQLVVNPYMTFIMQPNLSIMGAFAAVEPARHSFEIINNGGTFCFGAIELSIEDQMRFTYLSGDIEMESPMSCIMFGKGGVFQLEENANCTIGQFGSGVLGLRPGGIVQLKPYSTLRIEGNIRLFGDADNQNSVYINLPKNTSFQFGKYSQLIRGNQYAGNMQLCFYMNGGVLDDSALSAEERCLIRRIYPSESEELAGDVLIVPNPAGNNAIMEFIADESGLLYWEIFDVSGTLMTAGNTNLAAGIHTIDLPIDNLPSGLYLVHCRFNEQSTAKKLSVL